MKTEPRYYQRQILAVMAAVGTVLLFVGGPDHYADRSLREFWNLGHILLFGIYAYLLHVWWLGRTGWPLSRRLAFLVMAGGLAGGLVELIQGGIGGRTPAITDVLRDMIGCVGGMAFVAEGDLQTGKTGLRRVRYIFSVLLIISLHPFVTSVADEIVAERDFPVLGDFEWPLETGRWTGVARFERSNALSRSGRHSLKIRLGTETYSGVFLTHFPGNWAGYEALVFSVYLAGAGPSEMVCRIYDAKHQASERNYADRFNRRIALKPGWNDIEIPLDDVMKAPETRSMDMEQIRDFGLFAVRLQDPAVVYLDYVRLTKAEGEGYGQVAADGGKEETDTGTKR